MKILVINGPNINMLGIRETEFYGEKTYSDLVEMIDDYCRRKGIECDFFQSNCEGTIIDRIQQAYKKYDGIVINPAGYTHTSIAIADALTAVSIPYVEVHISDVNNREDFRKISYIKKNAKAVISGEGLNGYIKAIKEFE